MFDYSFYKKFKRGPQIITLKDAGFISSFTGVQSGDKVVDAGAGSGFLAIYLGNLVAPSGRVYSYEKRSDFAEIARHNIRIAGLEDVVEVIEKDVFKGISEKEVDLITLDLPDAEKALKHAKKALKKNGFAVGYFPTIEQAKKFVAKAEKLGLKHVKTVEVLVREMLVRQKEGCRPQTKGIMHTGYLSFVKKQ